MQFSCESCKAQLQIADEKVRGKRLVVRCKRCGAKIALADPLLSKSPPRVIAPPPSSAPLRDPDSDTESTRAMDSDVLERALRASKEDDGGPRPSPRTVPPPPPRETPPRDQPIWFAMIQGQQIGPISTAQLGRKAKAGEIAPRTYLWKEGMDSWVRAKEIQEVVSAFAAPPAAPPAPARPTPADDKVDLPFESASQDSGGGASAAPPEIGGGEAFLLSPETRTPPGGASPPDEGSIPPLAADSESEPGGLVISTDPDDSPPAALDLARWGAAELSKPRAETPLPAATGAASTAAAQAFGGGQAQKRGPLRFVVLGIAVAVIVALAAFALFSGRNESKHSRVQPPQPAQPTALASVAPAATPAEALAKTPEHKPAEAPAAEPAAVSSPVPTDVLKKKVDESMPALQGCLDQALQRDPALRLDRVLILATVAPNGTVTSTRIDKRTIDQSTLGTCLKNAARNIRFPSFSGAPIPVDIPIVVADSQ